VASTPPYSWSNGEHSLREHLATTFDRLDGGGLRSAELDAIIAYISTMAPPNRAATHAPKDAKVARGEEIFNSKEAACSTCHTPGADFSDGQLHDVKSKTPADKSAQFNTPSLRGVSGAGPWFHDGRYKTLKDLFRGADGKMGRTKQLSDNDLDALESYLRTL
jgi:cytochrome c peroxidase